MAKCLTLDVIRCILVIVPINWFYICYSTEHFIIGIECLGTTKIITVKNSYQEPLLILITISSMFFLFSLTSGLSPAERRCGYILPVHERTSWSPYWKQFSNWLSSWQIGTLCNWLFKYYFLKSKISTYTITNVLSLTFWIFKVEAKAVGVLF